MSMLMQIDNRRIFRKQNFKDTNLFSIPSNKDIREHENDNNIVKEIIEHVRSKEENEAIRGVIIDKKSIKCRENFK